MVGADVAWMLTATGLVLLMTSALSFFYGGMVRFTNVVSTMLQSFIGLDLSQHGEVAATFDVTRDGIRGALDQVA